jgi:folylpolyglutamate synthase/dihydropteroate synthase
MHDKEIGGMLSALAPVATSVICTTAPNPRAATADELKAIATRFSDHVDAIPDPIDALRQACQRGRTVVVAGSIFLIGPIRAQLARDILRSS